MDSVDAGAGIAMPREAAQPSATSWVRTYGLALACVAITLALAFFADLQQLEKVIVPLFLAAIAITIWYAGTGPGIVAILLSGLSVVYFFTPPLYTFEIQASDRVDFSVFVAFALLVGWFSATRRRIEQDLRKARDQLEAEVAVRTQQASLLDLTHDTIFVRDMNDTITYWNRGAQELYGWTPEQAIGQPAHQFLKTLFPAPADSIRSELLRTGRWDGELRKSKADGSQVVVASRWSLRRDAQERPLAILETNNDISERKRGEERIRSLNADLERRTIELESSNRELEAFAYSTSHDLRAPLRHIAGYTELLQKNAAATLDDKCRRYVAMVLESTGKMGQLIDDLLAFSRIGRTEAQNSQVDMGKLVQEVRGEVEREAEGRSIAWKIGALPSVHGDRAMLKLALVNLLGNSIKFTRTRPQAQIEVGRGVGRPNEVVMFVKDNGVGFDMKYVNKLFGVFQRLHRPEAFEGTGIGLATVQRILARHGGRVWAEGVEDGGATFYLALPNTTEA